MAVPFQPVCPVTQKGCERACSGPCDRICIDNKVLSAIPPVGIEGSIEVVLHGFVGARLVRVEEDRAESRVLLHFDNGAYVAFYFDSNVLSLLGGGFSLGETS